MEQVSLTLPAQTSYVSLARTLAATMAARADVTIDRLEDIRLAVDEACSLVLNDADPTGTLTCAFALDGDALLIEVSAPTRTGATPPTDGFSWMVLSALVDEVDARSDDTTVTIALRTASVRDGARVGQTAAE